MMRRFSVSRMLPALSFQSAFTSAEQYSSVSVRREMWTVSIVPPLSAQNEVPAISLWLIQMELWCEWLMGSWGCPIRVRGSPDGPSTG